MNDDGMRLRVRAMLKYMNITETPQANKGRIHINKQELIEEVKRNKGRVLFDLTGYTRFKEEETTANKFPDVPQQVRSRFRPARQGEGPPGTFIREGGDAMPRPYNPDNNTSQREPRKEPGPRHNDHAHERRDSRRSYGGDDRGPNHHDRSNGGWNQDRNGNFGERNAEPRRSHGEEWRGGGRGEQERRGSYREHPSRGNYGDQGDRGFSDYPDRRGSYNDTSDRRGEAHDRRGSERRGSYQNSFERSSKDFDGRDQYRGNHSGNHQSERDDTRADAMSREPRRYDDRDQKPRSSMQRQGRDSYYGDDRRMENPGFRHSGGYDGGDFGRARHGEHQDRDGRMSDHLSDRDFRVKEEFDDSGPDYSKGELSAGRHNGSSRPGMNDGYRQKRASDSALYAARKASNAINSGTLTEFETIKEDPDPYADNADDPLGNKKRNFDDYQKQQPSRGYNVEPAYSKRRSV